LGKNYSNGKEKLELSDKKTNHFSHLLTLFAARGAVLLYLGIVIALPIGMVFAKAFAGGPQALWQALTKEQALHAFRLTFFMAGAVTLMNVLLGTITAFVLTRFKFPGSKYLDYLIDLPFAIPTSVIGLTLASLLGPKSFMGSFFVSHGITFLYHPISVFIAFSAVTLPFVIRAVQPLLATVDPAEEEAAITLGAGSVRIFFFVILPVIRPGIISGAVLTFARSLGEFGAVVFVAGTQPFHTEVASTFIFSKIEQYDFHSAASASVAVLTISYILLWIMRYFETAPEKRKK